MPSDLVTLPVHQSPAVTPAPLPPPMTDYEVDVAQARAEVAIEDAAAIGARTAPAAPAPPHQPSTRYGDPRPPANQPTGMVPAARLAVMARERNELRDQLLNAQGQIEALRSQPPAGATRQPAVDQQPTLQEHLNVQLAAKLETARRFDRGEVTMEEATRAQQVADDVIATIRAQHLLAHIQANQPVQTPALGLADSKLLDEHLVQMAGQHPWTTILNENDIAYLEKVAREEATALGRPIGKGAAETYRLRQATAELSDAFGPRWYPDYRVQAPQPHQQSAAPVQAPRGNGVNPRVAQTQAALELAARQPPNAAGIGSARSPESSDPTEAQIEAMSEDEIMALPARVRARLLS